MDYSNQMVLDESGMMATKSDFGPLHLIFTVLALVGAWKTFEKAGEAGWKAIIPVYNALILLRLIGRPWWWIFLMLIPFVNLVVLVIVALDLGKSFGKGAMFSIFLLFLLAPIGFLILGFGQDKYLGPGGKSTKKGKK